MKRIIVLVVAMVATLVHGAPLIEKNNKIVPVPKPIQPTRISSSQPSSFFSSFSSFPSFSSSSKIKKNNIGSSFPSSSFSMVDKSSKNTVNSNKPISSVNQVPKPVPVSPVPVKNSEPIPMASSIVPKIVERPINETNLDGSRKNETLLVDLNKNETNLVDLKNKETLSASVNESLKQEQPVVVNSPVPVVSSSSSIGEVQPDLVSSKFEEQKDKIVVSNDKIGVQSESTVLDVNKSGLQPIIVVPIVVEPKKPVELVDQNEKLIPNEPVVASVSSTIQPNVESIKVDSIVPSDQTILENSNKNSVVSIPKNQDLNNAETPQDQPKQVDPRSLKPTEIVSSQPKPSPSSEFNTENKVKSQIAEVSVENGKLEDKKVVVPVPQVVVSESKQQKSVVVPQSDEVIEQKNKNVVSSERISNLETVVPAVSNQESSSGKVLDVVEDKVLSQPSSIVSKSVIPVKSTSSIVSPLSSSSQIPIEQDSSVSSSSSSSSSVVSAPKSTPIVPLISASSEVVPVSSQQSSSVNSPSSSSPKVDVKLPTSEKKPIDETLSSVVKSNQVSESVGKSSVTIPASSSSSSQNNVGSLGGGGSENGAKSSIESKSVVIPQKPLSSLPSNVKPVIKLPVISVH